MEASVIHVCVTDVSKLLSVAKETLLGGCQEMSNIQHAGF